MEWISVQDKLPEEDQEVWYYFDVVGVHKGKYTGRLYFIGKESHFSNTFYGKSGFLTDDVTHWMPYLKEIIIMDTLKIAIDALLDIKNTQGKVCSEYEICTHTSCQSSYNSWAIADKALREIASQHDVEERCEYPCKHCGAGDEIHHSYSCPTNLHPDKRTS